MRASINWFRVFILPIQLILIGFVTPSSAQPFDTVPPVLPPEIMADRYLVKAEQFEAGKDFTGALKVMDKVFAMQKEYDLKLPDEILYKYARVAMSADSVRVALASVNRYLVAAGKEGAFYMEALALSLLAEEELQVPEILAEDMCTGKQRGAACWRELANHAGCYVWDEYYNENQTVTWSGSCSFRAARANGTITRTTPDIRLDGKQYGEDSETATGRLRYGKFHGHWILRDEFGNVSEGPYVDGVRHGPWVEHFASNSKEKGGYVHGKREGSWLSYFEGYHGGYRNEGEWCTSKTYRQGEEIASWQVDRSNCQGW